MIERKIYSVSQISRYIRGLFEMDVILNSIWVRGEISNLKVHSSGHIYFTLKDSNAAISAVMFESYASLMPYELENGMDVIICGYISSYEKTGRYQIYVQIAEPTGVGGLAVAFEQLKKKLSDEGLFDEDFKREIPKHPTAVAVITSPTGAAVRDVINIISRRDPSVRIVVCPVLVQGENAADTIVQALKDVNEYKKVDTIILGRGGGSAEDLQPFNEEKVARAIFASEIPVISAVGHETDFTIADFVSDLRAPTPSAAAELAVSDSQEENRKTADLINRIKSITENRLKNEQTRINSLFGERLLRRIEERTANAYAATEHMQSRINSCIESKTEKAERHYDLTVEKLKLLSPLNILKRGYAAVFDNENKTISSVETLAEGDNITIRFFDGSADAVIKKRDCINGKKEENL